MWGVTVTFMPEPGVAHDTGGDDETAAAEPAVADTELHEPAPEPDVALAYSDAIELPEQRRSRLPAVVFAIAAVALAAAVTGWLLIRHSEGQRPPGIQTAAPPAAAPAESVPLELPALPSVTSGAPPTAQTEQPPVVASVPDRFVAMAVSPRSGASGRGGYAVSDTQGRAEELALSECKAVTGDDLCLVIVKKRNGCAAYAVDNNGALAGGSSADEEDARAAALERLPSGHIVAVHCAIKGG
jgi:hypothetical protein